MTREQATGIAYDASLAALADPGAAGDFFRRHRPRSAAAWCAEFARLAYGDFATVLAPCLADIGFELVAAPFDRQGTQGFLAAGPDFAVLVFRGSDDLAAWATNLDALPAPWRGGGNTHRGFAEALDAVWPEVEAALARTAGPLLFTGHSLGAALATLAASLRPEAVLYTFGSPRVGDAGFEAATRRRPGFAARYVNHRDIVCRVPSARLGYRHIGEAHVIDRAGRVHQRRPHNRGVSELLASAFEGHRWDLGALLAAGLPRELTDHAPINYVSALR
jgi:hypothetical protein